MATATLCNLVNALAALRELLVASRLPVNFANTPHTTQIDTMQSKVDAPSDSEYAGAMPVAAMLRNVHKATQEAPAAPISRHVQTPAFVASRTSLPGRPLPRWRSLPQPRLSPRLRLPSVTHRTATSCCRGCACQQGATAEVASRRLRAQCECGSLNCLSNKHHCS